MREILTIRTMLRRQEPKLVRTASTRTVQTDAPSRNTEPETRLTKVRFPHELPNDQFRELPPFSREENERQEMVVKDRPDARAGLNRSK